MSKFMIGNIIFIVVIVWLSGCSSDPIVIQTNNLRQTNYNYFCLEKNKSFSEIILCLKLENDAEKKQNNITNDLLDLKDDSNIK